MDPLRAEHDSHAPPGDRPSEPPIIELRRVSRSFGGHVVLDDLSLQVHRGETLVLIGESGCGKSVTLKLMMALLEPTGGEVLWNGTPVTRRSERQLTRERLRFGYLFQGAALFDSLTVSENVAFGLRQNTRLSEGEIGQIVRERLREVGLPEVVSERKPAQLSGGMKKRVGLARALAMSPEVMFYDEPTTGLDPIMSDVINELILKVRSQRPVTSVVVSHDMRTVHKVADRVIMLFPHSRLEPGESQIVFEGTPYDALAHSAPRVVQFMRGEAGERIEELSLVEA
ncbi:MAG TPA: ABC transporter ATP-binding protein [Planctomycetaceae bacterium]|nr:ABC transporter ATP-binding protein [Planctomycetaceae bacterium]